MVSCAFSERVIFASSTVHIEDVDPPGAATVLEVMTGVTVAELVVVPMVEAGDDTDANEYRFMRALPPHS
jgi:hypothetical protein